MLVEHLENRQLLSASSAPAVAVIARHQAVELKPSSIIPVIDKVDSAISSSGGANTILTRTVSGGEHIHEFAHTSIIPSPELNAVVNHHVPQPAVTKPAFPFTLRLLPGTFNPSDIAPFPAAYNFNLNYKTPLKLFNIRQTIGKNHLLFTGTMKSNLKSFSGVLQVTGPNRSLRFTYIATLTSAPGPQ